MQKSTASKNHRNLSLVLIALAVIVSLFLLSWILIPQIRPAVASFRKEVAISPGTYRVTEVFDGDTISVKMDGRTEKVRMIGVDTPETHKPNSPVECWGPEASSFAKQSLQNSTVRLVADPTNQNRDRYDRLLRYVYTSNGELFNQKVIEQGYGFAYTSFPFEKRQEFETAQQYAAASKSGVWGSGCTITGINSGRPKTNAL
jgi:micrococcal nuclease